jgi:hypothetical protein
VQHIVPPGRVVGLDMARCLALLGMMATHALVPVDEDGVTFVQQLAGGRASALFALLAGVTLALTTGGTEPVRGPDRVARSAGLAVRALVVAAVGLALGHLDTGIAVILAYYGVLFLFGVPFLGLRARSLAVLSGIWLCVVPVLSHLLRPHLPAPGYDSPDFGMLAAPGRLLSELLFTGYYPAVPWLAYLLAGMAIGRLDLSRARAAVTLLVPGLLLAAASWFLSDALLSRPAVTETLRRTYDGARGGELSEVLAHGLFGTTPTGSWWWLAVRAPHSATPFDLAHTLGSAMVVIGVSLLLARLAPRTLAVVFGAGAMTLTLYTAHVVMRTPQIWPGDGPDIFARHAVFALSVGALFRLRGVRGPLEAVVRRLSDAAASSVRATWR